MLKLFTYMVAWWWSIDIEYPATVKSFCTLEFALNMDIEQQTWIGGVFYINAIGSKSYPSLSQYHLVAIQLSELHIFQVILWPLLNSNSVEWIERFKLILTRLSIDLSGTNTRTDSSFVQLPTWKELKTE